MHKSVAGADGACNHRKIIGHIAKVAHHAVGQRARHAKPLMHGRIHLDGFGASAIAL